MKNLNRYIFGNTMLLVAIDRKREAVTLSSKRGVERTGFRGKCNDSRRLRTMVDERVDNRRLAFARFAQERRVRLRPAQGIQPDSRAHSSTLTVSRATRRKLPTALLRLP